MTRVLLPFPLQRGIAKAMAPMLGARVGRLDWRRFPDGESLVVIDDELSRTDVANAVFVAIHAVFAEDACDQLFKAGAAQVVSTDSIPYLSNAMSIAAPLADACVSLFECIFPREARWTFP